MKKTVKIVIDCANCAAELERALEKIEGVNEVSINFMTQKMIIDIDDNNIKKLLKRLKKLREK